MCYYGVSFGGGNRVHGVNHQSAASHWQTLSHNAVSTVENSENNAGLIVNSLKIKRQIWIFEIYFWFICIKHCIHNTKSRIRWINYVVNWLYNKSAAIIGYCGLLTTSECVPFLWVQTTMRLRCMQLFIEWIISFRVVLLFEPNNECNFYKSPE
jgi:hypothetical protein